MNFHRIYALKGFFGSDGNSESEDAGGGFELPENARLYYVGAAESEISMDALSFESGAVGELQE